MEYSAECLPTVAVSIVLSSECLPAITIALAVAIAIALRQDDDAFVALSNNYSMEYSMEQSNEHSVEYSMECSTESLPQALVISSVPTLCSPTPLPSRSSANTRRSTR